MESIRIHCFQHVPYETSGIIQYWAEMGGHQFTTTITPQRAKLPATKDFDWLIVLGGPMSVNDEEQHPWIKAEMEVIDKAIKEGKIVLGICFGAQLVAKVLGAKVSVNRMTEIGWLPVQLTNKGKESDLFKAFPLEFKVFQWHMETFDIPYNAIQIAKSTGCANQGFIYKDRVVGLQFHLEVISSAVLELIENHRTNLIKGKYIQSESEIINGIPNSKYCNEWMEELLNRLEDIQKKTINPLLAKDKGKDGDKKKPKKKS
jgi:GMP synthase-like glutamine amidotransferase